MKWLNLPLFHWYKLLDIRDKLVLGLFYLITLFIAVFCLYLLSVKMPFISPEKDFHASVMNRESKQNLTDNPSFEGQVVCTIGDRVDSVFPVDLDGDGQIDIVYGDRDRGQLIWLKQAQEGGLNFTKNTLSLGVSGVNYLHIGDVDKDSDMDIFATLGSNNQLVWFKQVGVNTGEFVENRIESDTLDNPSSVILANVDNDDTLDIIAASFDDGLIIWYEFADPDHTTFNEIIISDEQIFGLEHIQTLSVNEGSPDDLIAVSLKKGALLWYKNDGQGDFSLTELDGDLNEPTSVQVKDLNDDDITDIVVTDQEGCYWYQGQNDSELSFQERTTVTNLQNVSFVQVEDLDQDGKKDLIIGAKQGVFWYKNTPASGGDIDFIEQTFSGNQTSFDSVKTVSVNDLNQDGYLDVVLSTRNGEVAWLINSSSEPDIFAISGENEACLDSTYTYSVPNTPGVEYIWSIDRSVFSVDTSAIQVTWSEAGERIITLKTKIECRDTLTQVFHVDARAFPQPKIMRDGTDCRGIPKAYSIQLTDDSNEWYWDISGGQKLDSTSSRVWVCWDETGERELILHEKGNSNCFNHDILKVNVSPTLKSVELVTGNNQNFTCFGEPVTLEVKTNIPAETYTWFCDDKYISGAHESTILATQKGRYKVSVRHRCTTLESSEFEVFMDFISIDIPNVVTPNGDGKNDVFKAYVSGNQDIKSIHMMISDRFGNIVFQTSDIQKATKLGWDGGNYPTGIYQCVVKANLRNCGGITKSRAIKLERRN